MTQEPGSEQPKRQQARYERVILIVLDSLGVGAMPDAEAYGDAGSNTLGHILATCPATRIPNLTALGLLNTLVQPLGAVRSAEDAQFAGAAVAAQPAGAADALATAGAPAVSTPPSAEAPVPPPAATPPSAEAPVPPPAATPPPPSPTATAAYGRLALASAGKDTITGHWEIAGLISPEPFQTFERFPDAFIAAFEEAIGTAVLGNRSASGTQIIEELGAEHERTGKPIVYTSHDSVFQIAANTAVVSLERLYAICETARALLTGPLLVGRVIARPYVVEEGLRRRTAERRDYAVAPPAPTLLDHLQEAGQEVVAIGKIEDIFSGAGITQAWHIENNEEGCERTSAALREMQAQGRRGLIFTNLVDFDSHYGHRRDAPGYARALEAFDAFLPRLWEAMGARDLLILTADHGNDPCAAGFNHTREYVPVLYYGSGVRARSLATGDTLADIGATVASVLGVEPTACGTPVAL